MSHRFIFFSLLLLSVCWTSTCEAQLFRRGAARRANQAYYPQQYARQAPPANCNNRQATADSQTEPRLYRLPNGRYAVLRDGRYYYAQPNEIQASLRQQQVRGNAYAEKMYGRQADQAARLRSANGRSNLAGQRSTAPTPAGSLKQSPAGNSINLPPASSSIVGDGSRSLEGPAIVGPTVVGDAIPTLAQEGQSVIQRVDGALPVGTIPPAADIPTTDAIPTEAAEENFSVLEKSGSDK